MSFKQYRRIDLITLIIIGIITEALGVYLAMVSMYGVKTYNPYSIIALGLIALAVTRYGWYGAILIPFLAISNTTSFILTSINFLHNSYSAGFYVVRGIGCLLTMSSPLILMKFYKDETNMYLSTTSKVASTTGIVSLLAILIIYIFVIINSYISEGFNLSVLVYLYAIVYALVNASIGILAAFLINILLYKRGTYKNVYEMLLDKKQESEAEKEYYNVINREEEKN